VGTSSIYVLSRFLFGLLTSRNICTVPAANRVGLSRPRHADLLPFASGRQGHPAVGTCNTYHVFSVLIVDPFDR